MEEWDQFDEEGILLYVVNFVKNYVQAILPNSLFPVAVKSPITKEEVISVTKWPEEHYWDSSLGYIEKEHNGKEFIGFDVSSGKDLRYLIWNKTDGVFVRVKPNAEVLDSKICYKNIIVRDWDNSKLDVFCPYTFTVDFMGLQVRDCLHLHRNSFLETFELVSYIKECFWIYLYFLDKNYKEYSLEENDGNQTIIERIRDEKCCTRKELWCREWCSHLLQLICMVEYPEIKEIETEVLTQNIAVEKFQEEKDGEFAVVRQFVDANDFLRNIRIFYKGHSEETNKGETKDNFAILIADLKDRNIINKMNGSVLSISKNTFHKLIENKADLDFKNEELKEKSVLLSNSILKLGVLQDVNIVRILKSDKRLSTCYFKVGNEILTGYMLEQQNSIKVVSESELILKMWDLSFMKRVILEVKDVCKYKEIQVKELPFEEKMDDGRKRSYIISPMSYKVMHGIDLELRKKVFYDYEKFRQFVFGKRGQESSSYNMLINWVMKNQIDTKRFSKVEIKECYECLLKDIYKEHIYPRCKRGK